ncbi:MAG: hypothetical protein ACTHJL_00595 [Amnibacterium sp.]
MDNRTAALTTCHAKDCSLPAFRSPDTRSYAANQYLWICTAGHEIPEERPVGGSRGWAPSTGRAAAPVAREGSR